jgi:hypothetical protein
MAQQDARPLARVACPESCPDSVEQRIMCAYVHLAAAPDHAEGPRTVTLSHDPDRNIGWRSAQPSESCLEETSAVGIGATKHFNAIGQTGTRST